MRSDWLPAADSHLACFLPALYPSACLMIQDHPAEQSRVHTESATLRLHPSPVAAEHATPPSFAAVQLPPNLGNSSRCFVPLAAPVPCRPPTSALSARQRRPFFLLRRRSIHIRFDRFLRLFRQECFVIGRLDAIFLSVALHYGRGIRKFIDELIHVLITHIVFLPFVLEYRHGSVISRVHNQLFPPLLRGCSR